MHGQRALASRRAVGQNGFEYKQDVGMLKYWLAAGFLTVSMVAWFWITAPGMVSPPDQVQDPSPPHGDQAPQTATSIAPNAESNHTLTTNIDTDLNQALAPKQALRNINELPSLFDRRDALYTLLRNSDTNDVINLLNAAPGAVPDADYRSQTTIMLVRLAELDPERAFEEISTRPSLHQPTWFNALFYSWALQAPLKAQAAAQQLSGRHQQTAMDAIARVRPDLGGQHDPFRVAVRRSGQGSFEDAWRQAQSIEARTPRLQQLMMIAYQWASSDPERAVHAAQTLDGPMRTQAISQVLGVWAQQDFQAALDWAQQRPQIEQATLLQGVIQHADSLQAALAIAEQMEPENRVMLMTSAVMRLLYEEPEAVSAWAAEQQDPEMRELGLKSIAHYQVNSQPVEQVFSWLQTLSDTDRGLVTEQVFGELVQSQPDEVAARLDIISDATKRQSVAANLVMNLSYQDFEVAEAFIEQAEVKDKNVLFATLVRGLSMRNPGAALQYALQMSNRQQRDAALLALAEVNNRHMDRTILNEVSDPEVRNKIQQRLAARAQDPDQN